MMTQTKEPQVTVKNTKTEILSAYEALLDKAREMYKKNKQQEKAILEKERAIEQANQLTPASFEQNLQLLKKQVDEQVASIGQQLTGSVQQLHDLQSAIEYEKENLQEMYQINKTAHTLDTLLLAHQRQQTDFKEHMDQQKLRWELEKKQFSDELKETQRLQKNAWQREKDEYTYQTMLQREKEQHEYESKKAKQDDELEQTREQLSREFSQREAAIAAKENELAQLQQQVAAFPESLADKLAACEQAVQERLTREHKFQFDLLLKERDGERRLSEQTIKSLEAKIHSQEQLIHELSEKANRSLSQVQDIAVKAIEGASHPKTLYYPNVKESTMDVKEY